MLLVVMMHLGLARGEARFVSPDLPINPFTGVAIPMFFMVSGYLMSKREPSWRYSSKKIWGILRFCLVICIPLTMVLSMKAGYLKLQFPQCLIQRGYIAQFWYFGSMMIIYALLPFLLRIINSRRFGAILVGLGILCSMVFVLNVLYGFERQVIQTFRLWNWLFYFLWGAYICIHLDRFRLVKWYWIVPSLAAYILFFRWMKLGANEYYFCSPVCIVHATVVFVAILNLQIAGSKVIAELSKCFLPIYTLHTFIEVGLCTKTPIFMQLEQIIPSITLTYCIEYVVVAFICIVISLALMRLPYMDKIFKI